MEQALQGSTGGLMGSQRPVSVPGLKWALCPGWRRPSGCLGREWPPYSTPIRVRGVERKKRDEESSIIYETDLYPQTLGRFIQGQMSKVHPLTCLTPKNRIKPFSWRAFLPFNQCLFTQCIWQCSNCDCWILGLRALLKSTVMSEQDCGCSHL